MLVTTNAIDFLELARHSEHRGVVITTARRVAGDALARFVRELQQLVDELELGHSTTHLIR